MASNENRFDMAILFRRKDNTSAEEAKSKKALDTILSGNGIIVISRGIYGDDLINAVRAAYDGGIRAVEVAFEQDGDLMRIGRAISSLVTHFADKMTVGAGTVLTRDQLEMAYRCGAEFIVSPNTNREIISATKKLLGLASIPGATTPTEIINAFDAGADIVKIFPAGALGPAYFSSVTTPLSHIRCAAVAGVTTENIKAFKKAGACAFGISSSILNKKQIAEGRFDLICENARKFVEALNE